MAVGAAWNVNENKNEVSLTDLTLSNVEALARGEGGGRGCSVDFSSICETSHNDYTGYLAGI